MTRKLLLIIFGLFFLLNQAFAISSELVWRVMHNPSTANGEYAYATCSDGQYIYVVGSSYNEGDGDTYGTTAEILKIDKNTGNIISVLRYEPIDNQADDDYDFFYDCVIVNNYLFVVGKSEQGTSYEVILKIDLQSFAVSSEYSFVTDSVNRWAIIRSDGTYLYVLGTEGTAPTTRLILQKLDLNGNILKTYTKYVSDLSCDLGTAQDFIYFSFSLEVTNNFVYVSVTYTCAGDFNGDGSTDYDSLLLLLKLDKDLNEIMTKRYNKLIGANGFQIEIYGSLVLDEQENIYLAMYYKDNNNVYHYGIIKFSQNLDFLQEKIYFNSTENQYMNVQRLTYYKNYIIIPASEWDGVKWNPAIAFVRAKDLKFLSYVVIDNSLSYAYPEFGDYNVFFDTNNKIIYIPTTGKVSDELWVIYAVQINLPSVEIINKRAKEYISKVNVIYKIWSYEAGNVTVKFYLNDTVIDTKSYTLAANQTIYDSYIFEILKEGTYKITVEANFTDLGVVESDSFIFTLDLYDENVSYSNFTLYNSNKYVDTLDYEVKVRCGALNHNITIDAWNNRTYTIVCDNQTHTITDSFRFKSEGLKQVWFKLNAINPADSRYFGNDTFVADLNPPTIEYLNYTLTEGFRNDLLENATFKVSDTISPVIYCGINANGEIQNYTITNYAQEYSTQFNLSANNLITLQCRDLLNHATSKQVSFNITLHRIEFVDDINNTEGIPRDSFTLYVYYGSKQLYTDKIYKYLVLNYSGLVEYYYRGTDPNKTVISSTGIVSNSYLRYFFSKKQNDTIKIYYSNATRLYEISIKNEDPKTVYFFAQLNGVPISYYKAQTNQYGYLIVPADLIYDLCAQDENTMITYCFERIYASSVFTKIFSGFPRILVTERVTFDYEKNGD